MLQHLHLDRPLVFLDCETTGMDVVTDRLVELGLIRLLPDQRPHMLTIRVNPEISIPAAATAIHGIRDEHLTDCPPFRAVAAQMMRWLDGADLAGFNITRFDLPFLASEFQRAGYEWSLHGRWVVDALTIFHTREPRHLAAAVRRYCQRTHDQAHHAAADALATAAVLDAMLHHYPDLPRTVPELHQQLVGLDVAGWFRRNEDQLIRFARGKYRDWSLTQVARHDPDFLRWLIGQVVLSDARLLIVNALEDATS